MHDISEPKIDSGYEPKKRLFLVVYLHLIN